MLDFLTTRPLWLGIAISIVITCAAGLATTRLAHTQFKKADDNIKGATNNLFRVFGVLFSLMMSLAFSGIVNESREAELAVRTETAAIDDTLREFQLYGGPAALQARDTLLEYTRLIVEDDWPALEDDELGEQTGAVYQQLVSETLALEPSGRAQEVLWSRIADDIDAMSDARQARLSAALVEPPVFFYVLLLGFLIIMALFGLFKLKRTLIGLLIIYSSFIGLLIYLILALNDPFQGPLGIDPDSFVSLLETSGVSVTGG
jgi:hypothetical protein